MFSTYLSNILERIIWQLHEKVDCIEKDWTHTFCLGVIVKLQRKKKKKRKRRTFPSWTGSERCGVRIPPTITEDGGMALQAEDCKWHLGVENSSQLTASEKAEPVRN